MKIERKGKRIEGLRVGILLLASFLLLLAGCQIHYGAPSAPLLDLPEGMGSFTLQLGGSSGRTIMPEANALQNTVIEVITLTFESGNVDIVVNRDIGKAIDPSDPVEPIILPAGTYRLVVEAFTTKGGGTGGSHSGLVARGSPEKDVEIKAGEESSASVALHALLDKGTGVFEWNITLPPITDITLNTAQMDILQNKDVKYSFPNLQTGTGTQSLLSGSYTVRFSMEEKLTEADLAEGKTKKALVWHELMYIYAGLTSIFEQVFTSEHFHQTHWDVTFNYNNPYNYPDDYDLEHLEPPTEKPEDTVVQQSVMHGQTFTEENDAPTQNLVGFRFDGWFRKDTDDTETKWDLDKDPIHEDIELFAKWTENTAAITLTAESIKKETPVILINDNTPIVIGETSIIISRSGTSGTPKEIEITVQNDDDQYNLFIWEIAGVGATSVVEEKGANLNTFTLKATDTSYNTPGGHILRLTVKRASDDREFQLTIPFTVE